MSKFRIGPPKPAITKIPRAKALDPNSKASPFKAPLFEQLAPFEWRGIQVPVVSVKVSFSQDLAEHKYWGRDGASVEATGRAPMMIEAVIPFVNGIVPGKGEKFDLLYPGVFRKFIRAFADRTTGVLQHPELGKIDCKPHSIEFNHDAQRRDGVEVTAHWVETILEGEGQTALGDFPIQGARNAAFNLDASKADILKLVPEAPVFEESFTSLMGKMTSFVDGVTNTVNSVKGIKSKILYRVDRLTNSLERAQNALLWPPLEACDKLRAAGLELPAVLTRGGKRGKKIGRYTLGAPMPLAQVVSVLPTSNTTVDDLIQLNPDLCAKPVVPVFTTVRYYV